jgi:molybdopterin molybdotransferase
VTRMLPLQRMKSFRVLLVLTVQSARQLVLRRCQEFASRSNRLETVPLLESFGRVVGEAVSLDRDQPPFSRSMRDGFALKSEDTENAPVILQSVGEVRAGEISQQIVGKGEAVQIMTGAPLPAGADAVVMVENTERLSESQVRVLRPLKTGANVAPKGSERLAGDTILQPGTPISSLELAVLATVGKCEVAVYHAPKVAILATGDELVDVIEQPGPAQIRNSNSFSLYGQVRKNGGIPVILRIARDSREDLKAQIDLGLKSDVVLISGGVSMGKYDLVELVFDELGVQVHFNAISMRPGKPTVFATLRDRWIFGLPGNPVSTFVAFELFVRPVLRAFIGLPAAKLPLVRGVLQAEITEKSGRTAFLPAKVTCRAGNLLVIPVQWKGSADIFGVIEANALMIVPLEVEKLGPGEEVDALLFEELDYAATEGRF